MSIDDYYESSNRVECLPPIIDEESEILVLGSVPGKLSLVRRESITPIRLTTFGY